MKWIIAGCMVLIMMIAIQCTQYKEASSSVHDRVRQLSPKDISSYHEPVKLEIAWVPYKEHKLVMTRKNEWKVVRNDDTDKESAMPVILVSYPNGTDSLWVDMTMDNEMLGRLIKHTLMTQMPIQRPFTEYVEIATCAMCHPDEIDKGFE